MIDRVGPETKIVVFTPPPCLSEAWQDVLVAKYYNNDSNTEQSRDWPRTYAYSNAALDVVSKSDHPNIASIDCFKAILTHAKLTHLIRSAAGNEAEQYPQPTPDECKSLEQYFVKTKVQCYEGDSSVPMVDEDGNHLFKEQIEGLHLNSTGYSVIFDAFKSVMDKRWPEEVPDQVSHNKQTAKE